MLWQKTEHGLRHAVAASNVASVRDADSQRLVYASKGIVKWWQAVGTSRCRMVMRGGYHDVVVG